MRVIFLDFDGVLTSLNSRWKLIPEKCDLLGKILEETNAMIVISSSWRRDNLKDTFDFLTNCERNHYLNNYPFPFVNKIIGQTERIMNASIRFGSHPKRGEEIKRYLESNPGITNYVILDDENDMLFEQQEHFVNTYFLEGLSEKDVKEAIDILNK